MVYPYAARSVHEDKKAAAQIVAGQAHMIAAKLCSQVFDPDEPLSKHPPLHLVRWAYIVRSAGDPVTQQVVESMLSRTKPGGELGDGDGVVNGAPASSEIAPAQPGEGVAPSAAAVAEAAASGMGAGAKLEQDGRVWVQGRGWGEIWEVKEEANGVPFFLNHREKLLSYSHPSHLAPLPAAFDREVDDRRRIYYVHRRTGRTQWLHPCAPTVVHGVFVQGSSPDAIRLRAWAAERGWSGLENLVAFEGWARAAFALERNGAYTQIIDKAGQETGLVPDTVPGPAAP